MKETTSKGELLLSRIINSPQNELENNVVQAFEQFNNDIQSYNLTRTFSLFFGGNEIDLNNNLYYAFLKDYMSIKGKLSEKQIKLLELEETYKLNTPIGTGIFSADKIYAETLGDKLVEAVFEDCGLKATSKNITKIKNGVNLANFYTQETATFMSDFKSEDDFCQNFIAYVNAFCKRLAENIKQNEK